MINAIEIECFRKHEDSRFTFEQGLVAVRGLNEAAKSTIFEAISYALFGTEGLRESFDKVVTWGKPESALKVTLKFTLDGVQYTIVRKKSGAELTTEAGLRVTGQAETRRYVEALLKTDAKVARNMMFASQGALRGALAEGPAKAIELISTLADFDLIDRVIALVQAHRPTGLTKAAEERLKITRERLAEHVAEPLDTSAEEAASVETNAGLAERYVAQQGLSAALHEQDAVGAREQIAQAAGKVRESGLLAEQLAEARSKAAVMPVAPDVTQADIEGWRAAMVAVKAEAGARVAYAALAKLPEPEVVWEGSRATFDAERARVQAAITRCTAVHNAAYMEHADAASKIVREQTCGLCGKDLTDVPEVVQRNVLHSEAVQVALAKMKAAKDESAAAGAELTELDALAAAARKYETEVQRYGAYVVTVDDRVPARWVWNGEPPADAADQPDYNNMIRAAEAALQAYAKCLGAAQAAREQVAALEARVAALNPLVAAAQTLVEPARARLKEADTLTARLVAISTEIGDLRAKLAALAQTIQHKGQLHAQRVAMQEILQTQASQAEDELKGMNFNNALLAKLRSAKPQIADKLWGIVLSSVSHYFSSVRGVPSIVTREDSEFKVDGRPVSSFSGSTVDSLGLALRVALTKTFLPAMPCMMLDEPGAAADDEREANMLGTIATAGFDQVLLISHSPLVDSFASQVVQL